MHKAKPINHVAVVTKHNSLLPTLARLGLSELRLLGYCLAHYDSRPGSEDKLMEQSQVEIKATVKDFMGIFPGIGKQTAYAVVRQAVLGIGRKPFEETILTPYGKADVLINWFSRFCYYRETGEFSFRLSPDIIPYVLNLKGDFTPFRLKDVYQFQAASSWKMYELLKRWVVKIQRWSVDLDELKGLLGIAGKYPVWKDFKKRVLDSSLKEINELSDITVKYEVKKRIRSVVGVVFFINSKNDERPDDPNLVGTIGDTNNDIRLLMGVGITQGQAETLSALAKSAGKDLEVIFDRVKNRFEQKPAEERGNKAAYIYKALYNEFTPSLFDQPTQNYLDNEDVKKQSQKNNRIAKEVWDCSAYLTRSETGICKIERPATDKCKICSRLLQLS